MPDRLPFTPEEDQPAFQMLWDCKFCGTKKLLGVTDKFCPNCGAPQDTTRRYFPSEEDKKIVSDPNYKYAGRDKICHYCQTPNSAAANFCKQCGDDLVKASAAALKEDREELMGRPEDTVKRDFEAQINKKKNATAEARNKRTTVIVLAVLAVLCIGGFALFMYLSNSTYAAQIAVKDRSWERQVFTETLVTLRDGDWRNGVPSDAYNRNCYDKQREFRRSEQYQCGVDRQDRGDGSFVEVPRMCSREVSEFRSDTYCEYNVDRWQPNPVLSTQGGINDALKWPNFTPVVGRTRESGRTEVLVVVFEGRGNKAGKDYKYEAQNETAWNAFKLGTLYDVQFNRLERVQWDTLKLAEPR
jgi:hypothetical protein